MRDCLALGRRQFFAGVAAILAQTGLHGLRQEEKKMRKDKVFELRQYTLRQGQRDAMIALFEEQFVEPQNALGARVIGMFRDLDDMDRFVWIRGFRDFATRKSSLEAFYGGPVWKAHRTAANATMIDSDNVLLLKPTNQKDTGFSAPSPTRRSQSAIYGARIFALGNVDETEFEAAFVSTIMPLFKKLGCSPIAAFVTDATPNNFPALPVRSDKVFMWFGRWPSIDAEQQFEENWGRLNGWRDAIPDKLLPALMAKPERLRLIPTERSALK